eukprot:2236418-Rhodomonas_salina.1
MRAHGLNAGVQAEAAECAPEAIRDCDLSLFDTQVCTHTHTHAHTHAHTHTHRLSLRLSFPPSVCVWLSELSARGCAARTGMGCQPGVHSLLSAYALPTRYPVLQYSSVYRATRNLVLSERIWCYAISGTQRAYRATAGVLFLSAPRQPGYIISIFVCYLLRVAMYSCYH